MKNFRDIELLSSYLDGQLSPSDSARLESRISSDLELASALDDLRAARNILRKLPARKAPRNFTLTRKMVGLKPPLPRSYSIFRFSTALASFLLVLTFAANSILPRISFGAAAPMAAQEAYGMGGAPQALEAPAATEAPALAPDPMAMTAPTATEVSNTNQDSTRIAETPPVDGQALKAAGTESVAQNQPESPREALISSTWQYSLFILGLLSALIMFLLRQSAMLKWK